MAEYIKRTIHETRLIQPEKQVPAFVQSGTIIFWGQSSLGWGIIHSDGVTLALCPQNGFHLTKWSWEELFQSALEIRIFDKNGQRLVHAIRPALTNEWNGRILNELSSTSFPQALRGEVPTKDGDGNAYLTLDQRYWLWGVEKQKEHCQEAGAYWIKLSVDRIQPFWVPMPTPPQSNKASLQLVSREFFIFSTQNQALILADALPVDVEYIETKG